MAVYNGEKYLAEQIESVLRQTEQDFVLYINDDCSTDGSFRIAADYARRHPRRVIATRGERNSGGAKHNFLRLMTEHRNDYIMLCDQDDVWLPGKIAVTMDKMREMEARYGRETPLLAHTDLCVADAELNIIAPSYRKYMNANYDRTELKDLLIQNIVTGCAMMYNKYLAALITQEPPFTVMHDWWLALVAAAFGRIGHTDAATVLYRQHGANALGAWNARSMAYKWNRLLHYREVRQAIYNTFTQAESFLALYGGRLRGEPRQLLRDYIGIPALSKWDRWRTVCRLRVLKHGLARKLANFIFI
jgi:glycosyltransferase involved in cell wall biosynthesis